MIIKKDLAFILILLAVFAFIFSIIKTEDKESGNRGEVNSVVSLITPKKKIKFVSLLPKVQDLGEVIYGEVKTTEFVLTNFTDKNLKITRVSTSCGCTKAKVEKKDIDPFEETVVSVSFDPAVHKDDTDLGDVTRTIFVETDNENFPRLEVEITDFVVKNKDKN